MNVPNFAFLQDEDYEHLRPYYDQAIQKGIITSAGSLLLQNGQLSCFDADGHPQKSLALQYVAASGRNRQIDFQQPLVAFGVPKNLILVCNDSATTEIYTLSLHDALPILSPAVAFS